MIKWNDVTWYSRVAAFIFLLIILPSTIFYIAFQYGKAIGIISVTSLQVEQQVLAQETAMLRYPYLCSEGTEFTLSSSKNMSLLRIIPGATVDAFFKATLVKSASSTVPTFRGSGITLVGTGNTVTINVGPNNLTCTPVPQPGQIPLLFEPSTSTTTLQ